MNTSLSLLPDDPHSERALRKSGMFGKGRSRRARSRSGFSLIEILTVISLMAVLLSIAAPALRGMAKGRGVDSGINQSSGIVSLARSTALLHREGARVLIDIDPASAGYLRRMGVVRGARQPDGSVAWLSSGAPQSLPEGIFFLPDRSNGFQTMQFDFKNSNPQDGAGSGSSYAYFEYDGSGRFIVPSGGGQARWVLAPGFVTKSAGGISELVVPKVNEAAMSGFILRRAGHVTYFRSADQIGTL